MRNKEYKKSGNAIFLFQKLQSEWQIAFYIAAGVYCIGAIAYIILAKGEIQEWADPNHEQMVSPPLELAEITEENQDEQSNHKI